MLEKLFQFEENDIQVMIDGKGDPWWIAHKVGAMLGLSNPREAVSAIRKRNESWVNRVSLTDAAGKAHEITVINEPALFQMIFKSRKEIALRFQDYVFETILPQIRKTGSYGLPSSPAEQALMLARQLIEKDAQVTELEGEVQKLIPRAKLSKQLIESNGLVSLSNWGRMSKLGARKIFDLLEADGILWRNGKNRHPYSYYMDMLYFELKEKAWENDKKKGITLTVFVTPKGQEWLAKRYL